MKLSKRVAKEFRPERNLIVQQDGEGEEFWVSDTYVAVRFNAYDYYEFREKYNSYKTTVDIPKFKNKENATIRITGESVDFSDKTPMDRLVDAEMKYKLTITNEVEAEVGEAGVRKLTNNDLGKVYFSRDYEFLIDTDTNLELVTAGKLEPIKVIEDGYLTKMIMPVRNAG